MKRVFVMLAALSLCSCTAIDGWRQFNPNYKKPTLFSKNWWEARALKKQS